jgi:hypothetical protein
MPTMDFEKSYHEAEGEALPSNKNFGLVFTVVFGLVGVLPMLKAHPARLWALAIGLVFLALTFLAPQFLTQLNRGWAKVGLLLHHIVSPLILGLVYILAVIPTGALLRYFGKDPLRQLSKPSGDSYWIARSNSRLEAESMTQQF